MTYTANSNRYDTPHTYRRCGRWGLRLPALSLGLWHNFGQTDVFANSREILLSAFDLGINHFDLANNYGPPAGAAECTLGRVLSDDLRHYRDELIISTKAGYEMWAGPHGDGGSRKYLLASLDQSLQRLGIDYVDIFYHHRPDPETPLEETCGALAQAVRSGKALYVGLSNYDAATTSRAAKLLSELGTPCVIHQPKYNLLERGVERSLLETLRGEGIGCIPFSPLAQGLLTNRYLSGIPSDARASRDPRFLQPGQITPQLVEKLKRLNAHAKTRGQTLAQMAVAWLLRDERITSVLVGASRSSQLQDTIAALENTRFDAAELAQLDTLLAQPSAVD